MVEYIKRELGMKWCPADDEALLTSQIGRGRAFLERYDPSIDWETDEEALALLIEYVRYLRAHALDEYKHNYFEEILSLSNRYRKQESEVDSDAETKDEP